ncbi:MAG: PadR family transcriptional regulator [Acidobacteria bacterium]|nr:PadR family transcriptional regulator [Acidobacteriota bacterium]
MPTEPERFTPLKPDVFAVLLVLLRGDAHGYAIMRDAPAQSTGTGRLQAGALYRILARLLDDGLIGEVESESSAETTDQRRRNYRITEFGREVAAAEARRMSEILALGQANELLERT